MTGTIAAYDAHAESWSAEHPAPGFWQEGHDWLREVLPPPARIVEFGSGTGLDARVFLRDGYGYSGIDASAGLLDIAQRNAPAASLHIGNLFTVSLRETEEPFDGFWSVATLLHIPKADICQVLRNISSMIRPASPGFITLKDGSGEAEETAPEIPSPRLFAYWEKSEFEEVLAGCGYAVLRYAHKEDRWNWHQFLIRSHP